MLIENENKEVVRSLATIQKITAIDPIPGADNIEVCSVLGWKVVAQKAMGYKVGDLVIYIEIDSWVPEKVAPFLVKQQPARVYNGVPGERLRTITLRGQISQGLLLPLETLNKFGGILLPVHLRYNDGADVTEILGIQKWEKPIPTCLAGVMKGDFPSFVPKTDQERVQNLITQEIPDWIQAGGLWEVTEKIDGTSCTIYKKGEAIGVCSRNMELVEDDTNAFWRVVKSQGLIDKIKNIDFDVALQGELVGPGVQGSKYGHNNLMFYLFDIYNITERRYLLPKERGDLAGKLDIVQVPFVGVEALSKHIEWYLDYAEDVSQINPRIDREGVVFKSLIDRKSFKVISNSYLEDDGE